MSSQSRQERLNLYLQERNRVDELLQLGQQDEALALLEQAKEEARTNEDDDFRLLFEAMQIQIVEPSQHHLVELLNQALQWEEQQGLPMEQTIYLTIGHFYAENDDQETATAWFSEALKINERDVNTLRLMGASILKQGDPQTAIQWFNAALGVSENKDSFSWKEKSVAEQTTGNLEQALRCIKNAFKLRPDLWKKDYEELKKLSEKNSAVRPPNIPQLSPTLMQEFMDDSSTEPETTQSEEKPEPPVELPQPEKPQADTSPKEENIPETVPNTPEPTPDPPDPIVVEPSENDEDEISIGDAILADDNPPKEEKQEESPELEQKENKPQEMPVVSRENVEKTEQNQPPKNESQGKPTSGETPNQGILQRIQKRRQQAHQEFFQKFLQKSRLPKDRSLWFFLRTPIFESHNVGFNSGGGHFLWNGGSGTIIDPGFGFLDQFHKVGASLAEVRNVIITQDNESHLAQFETIRRLLLQGGLASNVRFYLNLGAMQKLSSVLDMSDKVFSQGFSTLYAGADYELHGGGKLKVLPAYRQEFKSVDHAVGLMITLSPENAAPEDAASGQSKKIVYTGDTGLFPLTLSYDSAESRIVHISDKNQLHRVLSRRYLDEGAANADLMVLHIASLNVQFEKSFENVPQNIKTNEMDHVDLANRPTESQLVDLCSVGELGYLGVREMISSCTPKFAAVCAWTQDMLCERAELCSFLQEQCGGQTVSKIVPEDVSLVYDIFADTVFDCVANAWTPAGSVSFGAAENSPKNLYFFSEEKRQEFETAPDYYVQRFANDLKFQKNMYFL